MRTLTGRLLLLSILFTPCSTLFAESPAPLGKMLSRRYAQMGPGESAVVLVYFKDKGPSGRRELHSAAGLLSERSIARRERVRGRGDAFTEEDLPLDASYVGGISGMVVRTRHALKWFNAVSVEATKEQIDRLRLLPYVREIELVGRWKGTPEPEIPASKSEPDLLSGTQAHLLNYGGSLTQNEQIGVTNVHDLGIFGEGVVVGVFDNGFRLLTHESFDSMDIIAQYDFVDHKVSVVPGNPSSAFGSHGVNTLSTVGGYKPGQLIGPAFRAKYVLARTENDSSETAVEEDNWAAAIEWADSIGIDVASTSLGYLGYDGGGGWSWVNMDGNTTLITQAADHAVSVGIVVVNSAGNEGPGNGTDNTLMAPADGDSVIAAGAVTSTGARASFSSVGPTTDVPARIKPDIMAMGQGVRVASSTVTTQYGSANGTSFSCPLSAGVAALILSAHPTLTPMQVRDAMRNTANNAATPDNQYGWGLLDADSAIRSVGITPMAKLTGTIYHDVNGNGARDVGEPGLPGEYVIISGSTPDTALSGVDGDFFFDSLAPGAHALSAGLNAGWMVSTPPAALTPFLLHRDSLGGFSVGLFETGAAGGTVYFDANENGTRDTLETPLDGWIVTLSGPRTDTAFTNLAGAFSFIGLPPGAYSISQVQHAGWLQKSPPAYGAHSFTVTSGFDSAGLDFGNFYSETNAFPVSAGWNLLSLPIAMLNANADSVYPNALSSVSLYDAGYHTADTLPNGKGYWVKFPAPQNILISGLDRLHDTVAVVQGWNLIGDLSLPVPVGTIVQEPGGIVASKYYGFRNNAYVAIEPDSSLIPHAGYWVKCSAAGVLILDAGTVARLSPNVWVGKMVTGGVQCDWETYTPPDTRAVLEGAGIEVNDVFVEGYYVVALCGATEYAAMHYALIGRDGLGEAEALGFTPMDPPAGLITR
jgi:serine protease AprX